MWYGDEGAPHDVVCFGPAPSSDTSFATPRQGEVLFAYLDDIYVLSDPSCVAEIFLQVKQSLFRSADIQVNLGKTKVGNNAAIKPEDLDTIGAEAWTGEGPEEDRGRVVLGVPVGHRAFVQKSSADKEQSCAVSQSDPSCPGRAERMVAPLDVRQAQGAPHPLQSATV